jgi:hypothetical protein
MPRGARSADVRLRFIGCRYRLAMTSALSHDASGALRRFAGWVARGSVGHPMLEGINYCDEFKDSPSQIETCFAIFANVLA